MLEALGVMIKEEWRIHSTIFRSRYFAAFPLLLFLGSAAGCFLCAQIFQVSRLAYMFSIFFFIFGGSTGAFGLLGREAMNRRFGQASLVAYSARSLPVSEKSLLLDFFLKDIIYYLFIWIVPISAGAYIGLSPGARFGFPAFFFSLFASFMLALCTVFFLSSVYVRSKPAAIALFAVSVSAIITKDIPGYIMGAFIPGNAAAVLFLAVSMIASACASFLLFRFDFPPSEKKRANMLMPLSRFFRFAGSPELIAKDFTDFIRSEGGLGKVVFSFLFPALLVWMVIDTFTKYLPEFNFFLLYCLFMGVMSSASYCWVTEYDIFSSYSFLPLSPSHLIRSKIRTASAINTIIPFLLLAIAVKTHSLGSFLPGLVTAASVSFYVLAVTVYLTGLLPNVMLYNAKVFVLYSLFSLPPVVALMILSAYLPSLLWASVLLFLPSVILVRKALCRWDEEGYQSF